MAKNFKTPEVFHVYAQFGRKGDEHYRVQSFSNNSFFACLSFMMDVMRNGYFTDLTKLHFSFRPVRRSFTDRSFGTECDFDRFENSVD